MKKRRYLGQSTYLLFLESFLVSKSSLAYPVPSRSGEFLPNMVKMAGT
jgi:hypothetical protein